jgi:hypothetical protein
VRGVTTVEDSMLVADAGATLHHVSSDDWMEGSSWQERPRIRRRAQFALEHSGPLDVTGEMWT